MALAIPSGKPEVQNRLKFRFGITNYYSLLKGSWITHSQQNSIITKKLVKLGSS